MAIMLLCLASISNGFIIPTNIGARRCQSRFHLSPALAATSSGSSSTSSSSSTTTTSTSTTTRLAEDELFVLLQGQSSMEIKDRLVDLLSRMMGTAEDFRLVEAFVNILEQRYVPAMTLDFLNLAMGGEWQLLFSTSLAKWTKSSMNTLRLRDMTQRIETQRLEGMVTNACSWDWTEQQYDEANGGNHEVFLSSSGTFSTKCSYKITQGARMALELEDHILQPARGSNIPKNVPKLVSLLHRAMPKELFDPSEHAMDITYLDGNLRIVRLTGPQLEGVRDIFIRIGSLAPTTTSTIATETQGSLE